MRKILLATAAIAAIGITPALAQHHGGHGGGGGGIGVLGALALSGALGGGYGGGGYSACPYGYTYTPYGLVPCATGGAAYGGVNPWLLYGLGGFGGGRHR